MVFFYWNPAGYVALFFLLSDSLLDADMFPISERLKWFYAEQLYLWGLLKERLCVLKCSGIMHHDLDSLKMSVDCHNEESSAIVIDIVSTEQEEVTAKSLQQSMVGLCGTEGNTTIQCRSCLRPSLYCVLCLLPVRGLATCCHKCGHAGHTKHVKQWFEKHQKCPSN